MRLFDLVHSLTPKQLAYVKKRFEDDGSHHNITLINLIKKQKEANIEELIESTGGKRQNLNSLANKSIIDILRILRQFTGNTIVEAEILEHVHNIRILNDLEQYKLARQEIKRIANIYKKHRTNFFIHEVRAWELKTAIRKSNLRHELEDEKIIYDLGEVSQSEKNKTIYWELLFKTIAILRHPEYSKKPSPYKVEDIIKHPFVKEINNATSSEQKAVFFYINGLLKIIQSNIKKALAYLLKMLKEIESSKLLVKDNTFLYLWGLNDICFIYMRIGDKNGDKIRAYVKKIKNISTINPSIRSYSLRLYYPIIITLLSQEQQEGKVINSIKEFETVRSKYNFNALSDFFTLLVSANLIYTRAYDSTIEYITPILKRNLTGKTRHPHHKCLAKVFYLICQYSIGETKFVERLTPKTRRFLNTKGFDSEVCKMLLCFFEKADNHASPKRALKTLQRKVKAYKKEHKTDTFLMYIDVTKWLNNILSH